MLTRRDLLAGGGAAAFAGMAAPAGSADTGPVRGGWLAR